MDDVTFRVREVRAEVGEATLGPFADLVAWDIDRTCDVKRDLEIVAEVGADNVGLGCRAAWRALVGNRELIRLAGALVEAWRRGDKIGDVD